VLTSGLVGGRGGGEPHGIHRPPQHAWVALVLNLLDLLNKQDTYTDIGRMTNSSTWCFKTTQTLIFVSVSPVCVFHNITVPDHDGGRPTEINACILITHMVYL
jgi:hypothetical protein